MDDETSNTNLSLTLEESITLGKANKDVREKVKEGAAPFSAYLANRSDLVINKGRCDKNI